MYYVCKKACGISLFMHRVRNHARIQVKLLQSDIIPEGWMLMKKNWTSSFEIKFPLALQVHLVWRLRSDDALGQDLWGTCDPTGR